jgi:hypothetical protein
MSFDEKIKLPSSDKFYMVRLQGGKLFTQHNTTHVASTFDAVLGATFQVYEAYIQKHLSIKSFYLNNDHNSADVVFTQVDEWSAIKVGGIAPYYQTFSYDPETGYIKFSSPLISTVTIQADEAIILEYYLFFTSHTGRRAPLDMAAGAEVYWQARLPKDFTIGFNQSNALNGQLSISTSSIELKNHDLYFNDFFGDHDSFNNREVKAWRCIDDTTNCQFDFSGVIRGAYIDDQVCTFDLDDILSVLDQVYHGPFPTYNFYSDVADASDYILRGDDAARPIYKLIGKIAPYDVLYYNTQQLLQVRLLNPDTNKMIPGTCVSYDGATKSTATNRKWSCGFGPSIATTKTFTCDLVQERIIDDYHDTRMRLTVNAEEFFAVGDTFKLGTQYGIVIGVVGTSVYTWPHSGLLAAGVMSRVKVPAVVVVDGNGSKYYVKGLKDYTCAIGPKGDLQITFINNFEAGYAGMGTLDPDVHTVFVRYWNDEADAMASDVVLGALEAVGISCNADFFPPENTATWPNPNLAFTVPFIGESTYPSARDVIEKALRSALAFIYLDSDGTFRFKSFLDGINTTVAEIFNQSGINPDDGLKQSNSSNFSVVLDLYDQYIGTRFSFSHAPQSVNWHQYYPDYTVGGDATSTAPSRLYKTNKYYETETVIDQHNNQGLSDATFLETYNGLMTGRRAEYSLKVFSRHFKMYIGDDVMVTRTKILGGENSQYMRAIAINKASNESELKLLDLKRFPK